MATEQEIPREAIHAYNLYIHGEIDRRAFARGAFIKSWGCHTGESMSAKWKSATGVAMEGARGPTSYVVVGQGQLPIVKGSWVR